MPYNPEAQFNAGLGLVGVQNVAQEIAEARKRYDENQKLGAYNDSLVRHAYQTGQISLDELNDYQQAAGSKKTGIAAGLAANMLDNHNREKDRQQQAYQNAQIDHLNAEAAYNNAHAAALQTPAAPFAPSIVMAPGPGGTQVPFAMTSPHSAQPLRGPDGGSEETVIDPVIDPVTKQPMAGVGVIRHSGQKIRTTNDPSPVLLSPDRRFKYNRKTDSWDALSPQFTMMDPNAPVPTTGATAGPPDRIELAKQALADPQASPEHKAAAKKILGLE
jgi:hypothetical protein